MTHLLQDIKYGLRVQRKGVGFTLIALLTLGLSIGSSTAVFSVINALVLKPLPYASAERIVLPWRLAPKGLNLGYGEIPWGISNFQRISRDSKSFASLGAFKSDTFNLTGPRDPLVLDGVRASAGFFPTLAVQPLIGRTFTAAEDRPGHDREVVLSYDLWQEGFSRDPRVLTLAVNLNGQSYSVIGVMPPDFVFPKGEEMPGSFGFPHRIQLWVPLALPIVPPPNAPDELAVIGRLKDGVTPAQLQSEMNTLATRMDRDFPGSKGWFLSRITPLTKQVAGDVLNPLLLTLAAVGVVLLIGCSNVANLLLAKSLGRRTEFALRAALGAARSRLFAQLLMEGMLLAAAGGLIGIAFAELAIRILKVFGPPGIPRLHEASLDPRVFAFALLTSLLTGVLSGLAPAFSATRRDLANTLREGGRGSAGPSKAPTLRNTLLVFEVALALVLVVASGLLVKSFVQLLNVDPGFRVDRVLTFELSLSPATYKNVDEIVHVYDRALQRFRSIPGVQYAGIVETVPLDRASDGSLIRIPDRPAPGGKDPYADYSIASPGYFSAVGTALLRGRDFSPGDTARSAPVTIINRSMAQKFWPGQDPLGKQVGLASTAYPLMTIVGVVANVKHLSLQQDPGPEIYVPYTQNPFPSMLIMHAVLRAKFDPKILIPKVRAAVHAIDPEVPVARVATLKTIVDSSLAGQRFSVLLLGGFAGISLLLASFGMYGAISFSVRQRTRDIGIRMALGAERGNILKMVVGQGVGLAALGVLIGLLVASAATRFMQTFLYGVQPTDLITFSLVSLLLITVATLACFVPALRATKIDPTIALRCD